MWNARVYRLCVKKILFFPSLQPQAQSKYYFDIRFSVRFQY